MTPNKTHPGWRCDRKRIGYFTFTKGFVMKSKPLVGLNADYRPTRKEGPALSFIAAGYYNAIQAAGGVPLVLPPLEDEDGRRCMWVVVWFALIVI